MLLRYFYDQRLAQASYMVGCAVKGEALVIDPARDIAPYLQAADSAGVRIAQVTETHIHADYVSGSRELAAHTGAHLYLSAEGGPDWQYAFAGQLPTTLLRDGDVWPVGNVRIKALHTPGHTPEHLCFLITDTAAADQPMGLFTGDFIFVGDVGRPDLLEEAAGMADTKIPGARQLFHSLQRIRTMPGYLQIWPGHGAGSACGKALGAVPSTTLGYELLFNPAFQQTDEDSFVAWLLDGQPEAPRYFGQMKRVNKAGPALLADLRPPARLDRAALDRALAAGALVVDLRPEDDFARAHVPGTLSIGVSSRRFNSHIGWFVDYNRPFYFIAPAAQAVPDILAALRAIGVDDIPGYFLPDVVTQGAVASLPRITTPELAQRMQGSDLLLLDVRGRAEYAEGHIDGALNIPMGHIPQRLDTIPHDRPVITYCASGYRSQAAASLLRARGYDNVTNLHADQAEWAGLLPVRA